MALASLSARDEATLPADAYDVRGWEVLTRRDDLRVGTVKDMLLDGAGWPRYLDVDADRSGKRILVPLERATAEPGRKQIFVRALTADRFEALPSYAGDPEHLGEEYEARLVDHWDRAERGEDAVEESRAAPSLRRLSDTEEHRVSGGSTDVRGWTVVLGDGRELGTVSELLFDPDDLRVRYLDCDVYEDKLELERIDRHVLIPVDHVRLEQGDRQVLADGLFATDLNDYPVYGGLPLSAATERDLTEHFRARRTPADDRARTAAGFFRRHSAGDGTESPDRHPHDGITMEPGQGGEDVAVVRKGTQEVRIRISGDDIVIEKRPSGEVDHG